MWSLLALRDSDSESLVKKRFAQMLPSKAHCIQVAVLDSQLVGYAWAQNYGPHLRTGKSTARLHDLFVDEKYRRRGVGRQLFLAVRDWAKQEKITWLQWQASSTAVTFYEKLGLVGDPCPDPTHPFFEIAIVMNG